MKKIKNILLLAAITALFINLSLSTFCTTQAPTTDDITLEQLMDDLSNELAREEIEELPQDSDYLIAESFVAAPPVIPTKRPLSIKKTKNAINNDIKTDLAHFNYKSASVLPFFTSRREKYVILSREAYGRPKIGKKWTYDDFGGTRDAEDAGALVTAAREFFEEAILDKSLHFTLDETCNFITNNVHFIIANTTERLAKHVTYIVDFKEYKNEFINNFYKARSESTEYINKEKDRIAIVKWSDIKRAFMEQENENDVVYVNAKVIDPKTKKGRRHSIKLRTYFVTKLKSFFLDEPHQEGSNKKIHFYS